MASQAVVSKIEELAQQQGYSIESLHATSKIEKVPLGVLKIDRDYQREPTQRLVDDIASNWDEVSAELLLVSDRGPERGTYVVNGQHRSLGARKAGVESAWARVLDLSEAEDPGAIEAMFRLRTNKRMGDKPLERFKAQVRAGDQESRAIVDILAGFDTQVNEIPSGETGINAISTVERLFRADGEGALLRETLQVIMDAYGVAGGRYAGASVLGGVSWFLIKHAGADGDADRDRLVSQMKLTGHAALHQRAIVIKATMGAAIWLNTYRALVELYNENLHLKQRLEWRVAGASNFSGVATGWNSSNLVIGSHHGHHSE